jgi:hypothetical protein
LRVYLEVSTVARRLPTAETAFFCAAGAAGEAAPLSAAGAAATFGAEGACLEEEAVEGVEALTLPSPAFWGWGKR